MNSSEPRGKTWGCASSVGDPHENMCLTFINKQVCGKDASPLCRQSLSPANTELPACCSCQVGWHGPQIPASHWEHMAGSASSSAISSKRSRMICWEMMGKWLWWWHSQCFRRPQQQMGIHHTACTSWSFFIQASVDCPAKSGTENSPDFTAAELGWFITH